MDLEKPSLTNPDILPSPRSLKAALGNSYELYKKIIQAISTEPFNLREDWNYYRDGKAWLCKVMHKKKTVFWLAAYEGYFKISFYFTLKNANDIAGLSISKKVKETFTSATPIGKLIPLTIVVKDEKQFKDILKLVEYKTSQI